MSFLKAVFRRTYCATGLIATPVKVFGIEGRYVSALYSAGHKEKKLEQIEKELLNFWQLMKTDKPLREFIDNPTIRRKHKAEAFQSIAAKLALTSCTSNLLQLLAENGRVKKLIPIIKLFEMVMSAHRGEVKCEVTTAKPLAEAQRAKLEVVLKKFIKEGHSIVLKMRVDPLILGGMVVVIGDRFCDMSVRTKYLKYREIMSQPA